MERERRQRRRCAFYKSTDATITTSDTEAESTAVAGLAASGSTNESVDVTAPATAGTYYYGACVDAVADESDTTNNCSAVGAGGCIRTGFGGGDTHGKR